MSNNLSSLSNHAQRLIELDKQASFLAYRFKNNQISRNEVKIAIENTQVDTEYFRDAINRFIKR